MPKPNPKCDEESALGDAARGDDDLVPAASKHQMEVRLSQSMAFCLSAFARFMTTLVLVRGAAVPGALG